MVFQRESKEPLVAPDRPQRWPSRARAARGLKPLSSSCFCLCRKFMDKMINVIAEIGMWVRGAVYLFDMFGID